MSNSHNRHGLSVVLEDPYKDDCSASPTSVVTPPTLSLPPLSSNNGYYFSPPMSPAPSAFPSSSFSTLIGWAGEYKHYASDIRPWPGNTSPEASSSSPWYTPENAPAWGTDPPQLQHPQLSQESSDWDRLEYRAASDLHLPVEPHRQLSFQEELRRANSNSS
jgi:hypothetical protein